MTWMHYDPDRRLNDVVFGQLSALGLGAYAVIVSALKLDTKLFT